MSDTLSRSQSSHPARKSPISKSVAVAWRFRVGVIGVLLARGLRGMVLVFSGDSTRRRFAGDLLFTGDESGDGCAFQKDSSRSDIKPAIKASSSSFVGLAAGICGCNNGCQGNGGRRQATRRPEAEITTARDAINSHVPRVLLSTVDPRAPT